MRCGNCVATKDMTTLLKGSLQLPRAANLSRARSGGCGFPNGTCGLLLNQKLTSRMRTGTRTRIETETARCCADHSLHPPHDWRLAYRTVSSLDLLVIHDDRDRASTSQPVQTQLQHQTGMGMTTDSTVVVAGRAGLSLAALVLDRATCFDRVARQSTGGSARGRLGGQF